MADNIFAEILELSKGLYTWQNEAIRRMFTKGELSQVDKDYIFRLAQEDHGLAPMTMTKESLKSLRLKSTDLPTPPTPGKRIYLNKVKKISNVNVLKGDPLSFSKQLTVIFGGNATGKSGYARVMKKAFRARAIDPILPNVYDRGAASKPIKAVFEIEEEGKIRDENWTDGSESPDCLGRFTVFDLKCARVYITKDSQLSFLPYGFDIIVGLGRITEDIKGLFSKFSMDIAPKQESIAFLINDTSVGRTIASIDVNTKEEGIKSKAVWGIEDSKLLESKEQELAKLRTNSPQMIKGSLMTQGNRLEQIKSQLKFISTAISDSKVKEIKKKIADKNRYEKAVMVAAKETFGGLKLEGIGSAVWRELLIAAEKYSTQQAYPEQSFPSDEKDAKCVLCLQSLPPDVKDRLKRFWKFIQEDISSKRDDAKSSVELEQQTLSKLPRKLPREIEVLEEALRMAGSGVFDTIKKYYDLVSARIKEIETAIVSNRWDLVSAEPVPPIDICDKEITSINKQISALGDGKDAATLIRLVATEIEELKTRQQLNSNLKAVLEYIKCLKLSALASNIVAGINTNAISIRTRKLQEKFVAEKYKKRIEIELEPFGLVRTKARISTKSDKGAVLHKLSLEGATVVSPEDVLSEGERTAISLACFLAELEEHKDNCGIILDDPLSSLDHQIRDKVIERLVLEARKRQVVIFTHDAVFYSKLLREVERQKDVVVKCQFVEGCGRIAGIISDESPELSILNVSTRVSRLEKILGGAHRAEDKGEVKIFRDNFRTFYDFLRSTWERAIEELLFNKVIERYDKRVKTLELDGVAADVDLLEKVLKGWVKASNMIDAHDHPTAESKSLPGYLELKSDLDYLKNFVSEYNRKKKENKEKLKKFKKPIP